MIFEVYAPSGQLVMTADGESTPYNGKTMLEILDAGYTIKADGKRVAKTTVKMLSRRQEVQNEKP